MGLVSSLDDADASMPRVSEAARVSPSVGAGDTWRRTVIWIVAVWFGTRACILALGLLSQSAVVKGAFNGGDPHGPFAIFARWDSAWYLGVAQHGYSWHPGTESNVVFYPLWPLLLHVLGIFGLNETSAGIVLNLILLLAAALVLGAVVQHQWGARTARRTVTLFLTFPAMIFYGSLYSEPLFVLLLALFFLALQRQRYGRAGVVGALLSATRSAGILVVVPLAIDIWLRHRKDGIRVVARAMAPVLVVPVGMIAFLAYADRRVGSWSAPFAAQKAWGRSLTWPWTAFSTTLHRGTAPFYTWLLVATPLLVLGVCFWMWAIQMPPSYIAYAVAQFLLIVSAGTLDSAPRFASAVLPLFVGLALLPELGFTLLVVAFSMGLAVMTVLFTNGYWLT